MAPCTERPKDQDPKEHVNLSEGTEMMTFRWLAPPLLLLSVAGCLADGTGSRTIWVAEFEYMRRGGSCPTPDGPETCELRVVIRDDGTWSASGVPEPPSGGELPLGVASGLAAIFDNSWRPFTDVPFTGVCPTSEGGEEYGYVARLLPVGPGAEDAETRVREVRSCTYDLERYDSLVKRNMIDAAWKGVRPPELAHVEFR